jgi:hypothetical protein
VSLCDQFGHGCEAIVAPPRRLCDKHMLVFCRCIDALLPDTLFRTFVPAPEFGTVMARSLGDSAPNGLTPEQVRLLNPDTPEPMVN